MTLLRDQMEPLARVIADCYATSGVPHDSAWRGYHMDEDLVVLSQPDDTNLWYVRPRNHEARIGLLDIRFEDIDPTNFDLDERIVLASETKSSDAIPFKNASSEVQEFSLGRAQTSGSNESGAILAGFEKTTKVSAEVSGGIKGIGEAKASVVDETKIKAEYQRQTGRSLDDSVTGELLLKMPPWTAGEARLTWAEQTIQNRIKGYRQIRCRVVIGRYQDYYKTIALGPAKRHINRWASGSPLIWPELSDLIAVLEKRGSVKTPLFEEYAQKKNINPVYAQRLKDRSRVNVDILTEPYKGSNEFRPEILASTSISH